MLKDDIQINTKNEIQKDLFKRLFKCHFITFYKFISDASSHKSILQFSLTCDA